MGPTHVAPRLVAGIDEHAVLVLADVGVVEPELATPVNELTGCLESVGLERGDDGWRPKPEIKLVLVEDTFRSGKPAA